MEASKEIRLWQAAGVGLLVAGLLLMPYVVMIHGLAPTLRPTALAAVLMGGFIGVAGFAALIAARLLHVASSGRPCPLLAVPLAVLFFALGLALLGYVAVRVFYVESITLRQIAGGAAGSFLLLLGILVLGAQRVQVHMLGTRRVGSAAGGHGAQAAQSKRS